MSGRSAIEYIPAFNISLFLTTDEADVRRALDLGNPAGRIIETIDEDDENTELRVALDFDGVIANDESEQVFQKDGMAAYRDHEEEHS